MAKVKHFPNAKTSHARNYLSLGQLNSKKEKRKKGGGGGSHSREAFMGIFFPRIKNSLTEINLPLSQSQNGLFLFNIWNCALTQPRIFKVGKVYF